MIDNYSEFRITEKGWKYWKKSKTGGKWGKFFRIMSSSKKITCWGDLEKYLKENVQITDEEIKQFKDSYWSAVFSSYIEKQTEAQH